jgi:hypothetical protein
VKTLSGKTIALDVNARDTVANVMHMIQSRERVPLKRQRLVHGGKSLEMNATLADHDVRKESTLHLTLRLPGGNAPANKCRHNTGCKRDGDYLMCSNSTHCQAHHPVLRARHPQPTAKCSSKSSTNRECGQPAVGPVGDHDYPRCCTHLTPAERAQLEASGLLVQAPRPANAPRTPAPANLSPEQTKAADLSSVPVARTVARDLVEDLQLIVREIMVGYADASVSDKARIAHRLLSLPKLHLRRPTGRNSHARRKHAKESLLNPTLPAPPPPPKDLEADERTIRSARSKAQQGCPGRAAKALFQDAIE